jgi:hypothetical protein
MQAEFKFAAILAQLHTNAVRWKFVGVLSLLHDGNPSIITGKENYSFLSSA